MEKVLVKRPAALKILIIMWPEASAYNATFRLARVLEREGHEVVYAVPPAWESSLSRQRVQTRIHSPLTLREGLGKESLPGIGQWRSVRHAANRRIDELCDELAWIKAEGFSIVLVSHTLWIYAPVLRRLGVPYASANPGLGGVWEPDVPPIFSPLAPLDRRGPNRARCTAAWLRLRLFGAYNDRYRGVVQAPITNARARLQDIRRALRHATTVLTEPLRQPLPAALLALAREEGAEIGWGDYGHRLAGHELVLGPRLLDFPRSASGSDRIYTGACVDTERAEDPLEHELAESGLASRVPLVTCVLGSHGPYWHAGNRRRLLSAVVGAFGARPERRLLLQASSDEDLAALGPLPPNVWVAPWFPQLQVLARADLVISHGGFGTVREALFHGVPLLIYPCGVDQPGNGARVAHLGAGLMDDIRAVTPEGIMATLDVMLTEPRYHERALEIGMALLADNDCREAVARIGEWAKASTLPR
jgi:zeaxanthin glucosyltransferase